MGDIEVSIVHQYSVVIVLQNITVLFTRAAFISYIKIITDLMMLFREKEEFYLWYNLSIKKH
jgi:hypothetical protein